MAAESHGAHGARRGGRLTSGGYERPLYEAEADGEIWPRARPVRSLPGEWPLVDVDVDLQVTAWMRRAKCAEHPQVDFFHGSVRAAKDLCAACPVTEDCLDYATTEAIRYGVWGGTTPPERITPTRRLDDADGFVYFAVGDDPKRIKIGTSGKVGRRLQDLRLTLIASERGSYTREAEIHERFRSLALGAEWFRYKGELRDYVSRLVALRQLSEAS